jgi:hypothetical protein
MTGVAEMPDDELVAQTLAAIATPSAELLHGINH